MLLKRYSESSVTDSIASVSVHDVSLGMTPPVGTSSVTLTPDGGGGGAVMADGVSIMPPKVVKERVKTSTAETQSCLTLFIVNLLSILF